MDEQFVVVYQAGIANVFKVDCLNLSDFGRNATRVLQSTFRDCETFAAGLAHMGAVVTSAYCNQAGDICNEHWNSDLQAAPFCEHFRPIYNKADPEWKADFYKFLGEVENESDQIYAEQESNYLRSIGG